MQKDVSSCLAIAIVYLLIAYLVMIILISFEVIK